MFANAAPTRKRVLLQLDNESIESIARCKLTQLTHD